MNLIFLYGPPASGKYTVGEKLSRKTGYKFFHNHLTVDPVRAIFEFGAPGFWDLVHKIRLDIFEKAAKEKIPGMIFTYVYEKDSSDDDFIKQVMDIVKSYGGEIRFVFLTSTKEALLERVTNKSRKKFLKVWTKEDLLEMLNRADFLSPIPFVDSHMVDNTKLTVNDTVKKIMPYV